MHLSKNMEFTLKLNIGFYNSICEMSDRLF